MEDEKIKINITLSLDPSDLAVFLENWNTIGDTLREYTGIDSAEIVLPDAMRIIPLARW